MAGDNSPNQLLIGWAEVDLTPDQPVAVVGQFHARISEEILDPITATVLAAESGGEHVIFVSCDFVAIPDALRDAVRSKLPSAIRAESVIMNATHTHTGPEVRLPDVPYGVTSCGYGVDLPVMPVEEYLEFASTRIANAIEAAWTARAPAKIAYGLGFAVVGRNRRWVNTAGIATMYGNTNTPDFSHIEGYEDHSVNVLATYDMSGSVSGLVVNVPCPSQVDEGLFALSADYWHDTRVELRRRLGENLRVLAQCSAAGDQSPHPIYEKRAQERMWQLAGLSERQVIARRIADTVSETLNSVKETATKEVTLQHRLVRLDLPLAPITQEQADAALAEAQRWEERYHEERRKLENTPELRNNPRWYVEITKAFHLAAWHRGVVERFKQQQDQRPTRAVEIHIVRLGDIAFATNPFEYYLDYGIYIKCRSNAIQTFLVQLAGGGTYVPTLRSIRGGGYGSVPASNPLGPDAGRIVAEKSVEVINELFASSS